MPWALTSSGAIDVLTLLHSQCCLFAVYACSVFIYAFQIVKILNSYTPIDDFEKRVAPSFVRKVQASLYTSSSDWSCDRVHSLVLIFILLKVEWVLSVLIVNLIDGLDCLFHLCLGFCFVTGTATGSWELDSIDDGCTVSLPGYFPFLSFLTSSGAPAGAQQPSPELCHPHLSPDPDLGLTLQHWPSSTTNMLFMN